MNFNSKKIKELDFPELVREAFSLTWKKKYLWWFGLLSFFGSLSQPFLPYPKEEEKKEIENFQELWLLIEKNWNWIIWLSLAILLTLVILFLVSIFFRGTLIKSIQLELEGKTGNFRSNWKKGKKYFLKILTLYLSLALAVIIIFTILAIPTTFFFYSHNLVAGTVTAILAVLILFPLLFIFQFLAIFGTFYLVLADLNFRSALESAYFIFKKNIWPSIIMLLVLFVVNLIFFIGAQVAIMLVFGFFYLLGIFVGKFFALGFTILLSIGALITLALFLLVASFYQVFHNFAWTMFFYSIAKKKSEEVIEKEVSAEAIPEPDAVGKV